MHVASLDFKSTIQYMIHFMDHFFHHHHHHHHYYYYYYCYCCYVTSGLKGAPGLVNYFP